MVTRRALFCLPFLPAVRLFADHPAIKAGDWVQVVSIDPEHWTYNRPRRRDSPDDWLDVVLHFRLAYGKRCRVVSVDDDGRVCVDVFEHVKSHYPGLVGCELSFDAGQLRLLRG